MSGGPVLALSGGVGGAKLVQGLAAVLDPADLIVVGNTGDDFKHLGLSISPDLDSVMYALAGLHNEELGWGQRDETWQFMAALGRLGGETWFRLGDRDLATHVVRTGLLHDGKTLTEATAALCEALGVGIRLIPMSDDPVRSMIDSDEGLLEFQDYFVRRQCAPRVTALTFNGAAEAQPQSLLMETLRRADLRAAVIAPSNPFISIEPILAVPGVRAALAACAAPVVAVSPVIGGQAVKGPTAKMMAELGFDPGVAAVLDRYDGLLDAMLVDAGDIAVDQHNVRIVPAQIMMRTLADKRALAQHVLDVADALVLDAAA